MHHHHIDISTLNPQRSLREIGPAAERWPLILGIVGIAGAVVAAIVRHFMFTGENAFSRFMFAYLHNFLFFVSITLGALFFVMTQHIVRAGWSVTCRRTAEIMAANIVTMAILFLPILVSVWLQNGNLYRWSDPEFAAAHELVAHKRGYLNPIFFTIRALIYFGIWSYLARHFYARSVAQDESHSVETTLRYEGTSAWGLLVTFLSVSFAAIDWAMSLDAEWFSTIFGVVFIFGGVVGFFASLWLTVFFLQSRNVLTGLVTVEHQHDIGKGLFMSLIFWTYVSFSQYLLIWYGDIPEETHWYLQRQEHGWQWIAVTLIIGGFIIPFFGLMSRHVKRNRLGLAFWCVWLLVMHWIDLYYIVMPQVSATQLPFGFIDVACFLGIGGLTAAGFVRTAANVPMIPVGDPRLQESLAFHNA